MVAHECGRWGCTLAVFSGSGAAADAVGSRAGRRASVHFLFLENGKFRLQQSVLPPQFRNLGRGGEGSRHALALHRGIQAVEFLDARFEVTLQTLIRFPEIALDRSNAAFEAEQHAFDGFDGVEEGFAKRGEHVGDNFHGGEVVVDEIVLVLPVGAAHGGHSGPQGKK